MIRKENWQGYYKLRGSLLLVLPLNLVIHIRVAFQNQRLNQIFLYFGENMQEKMCKTDKKKRETWSVVFFEKADKK